MSSVPGLPEIGSNVTFHITRVNLNPHSVLVEFGGNLNHGPGEVYKQTKEETGARNKRQDNFEGKPGDVCFIYDDKAWHRARIISRYKHEYNVFLIDKGELVWASRSILAKVHGKLLNRPPRLELCIMSNVSPLCVESGWSQAASEFLRSLCGKNISGSVQDVMMPYRIIVLDIPSISKQMYELGFAKNISNEDFKSLVTRSLQSPDRDATKQTDLIMTRAQECANAPETLHQYLYPELLPGTIEMVTVTHVVHPLKIFCKLHVFSQELKKLSDQLQEYHEDVLPALMSQPLSDGCPCATKGSDGKWYRSVLQQNTVSDVVKVFHVDYGTGDFVKLCNIRPLPLKFFQLPVVTYECSLYGIVDRGNGWRTDQIDFLKSIILDRIFIGKLEQRSLHEGVYHVTLHGNDNVNVNNIFGLKEDCLSVAERTCTDKTLETLNKVTYSCQNDSVSVCTTVTASSKSSENFTTSRTEAHPETRGATRLLNYASSGSLIQRYGYNVSPPKIKVGTKEKVWITCIKSVNQFYGHFAQNTDTCLKMTRDIQRLCQKRTQTKFSVSPKMMCFAKYTDGNWHRGEIESTHPTILVHFVDYGDVLALDKSEILPLTPEARAIASVPVQAVEFELFNLTLPESCDLNKWFENYVTDCVYTVTVMKQDPSGKLSVEMYDEKSNLNLKLKDRWNKTKKLKQGNNVNKGTEKNHACKVSLESMESKGQRENFSTTVQGHEKICRKQVVQGAVKQKSNFQPIKVNATGHSGTERKVLQNHMDKQQKAMCGYAKLTDLPARALDKGYVSEVYLSHCNSPSSFFVHLTGDEDKICSLQDELNSSQLSSVQVDLHRLQSGDVVRAECPADGVWYRAVVQNKTDDKVQVQFFDFGNKATLLHLKIRQLDKQFMNTPRLSIHCSLEGDTTGGWTKEQVMAFKHAAGENGEKKILCKFIHKDVSAWLVSLEHQGIVLKGPLFNVSHAQTDSQMLATEDTQPLMFKEPGVTEGQIVEVYASSICGPEYFWCQFKNSEKLDNISLIAQEVGNSVQTKQIQLDQLCPGVPCLARFSDELWYRAQVINKLDNALSVLFIDYGNESEVELNSVKYLSHELLERPPQAFLCQLGGFGSTHGTWNNTAADTFFELLVDEPLKVTVQSKVMTSDVPKCPRYKVLVECQGLVVNDMMKNYWHEFKPQIEINQCKLKDQSSTCPTSANNDVNALTTPKLPQFLPLTSNLPPRVIKPGMMSEVFISHINGPRSFFVQLVEDENTLFSISEQLNSSESSDKDVIQASSVKQGNLLTAVFPEDGSWYRAVVKGVTEKGLIQVEFIDFGNEATVSPPNICRLDEGLLSYPRFSIHCRSNIKEKYKIKKGLEDEVFLFKKIFGQVGEKLSCEFIKENGGIWEVKMVLKGSTPDASLCEKWDDLNLDALQICSANQVLSHVEESTPMEMFQLPFKKPDVSLGQTVEAFASCIVGPDYFWCQFANPEQLDQITLIAQEYGNSSETKPIQMDHLAPGSPCLAHFPDDLMWYRAQVIKKCHSTISVLFVDYGNESEVIQSSVKALPCDLLKSPPQAFLCLLEGFAPSEGSWDSTAANHFHELLVDKPLKVTVNQIKYTADSSSPPYCVKIEAQQCLINEVMRNFWNVSVRQDQNSAEVSVSCENSCVLASEEQHVSEENRTSETYCTSLPAASKAGLVVADGDLHEVSDNKVDGLLGETDIIATITNHDAIANGPTLLQNHKEIHESDDVHPNVSVEQRLLHSREGTEDERSEKDALETVSRCTTWATGLDDQMLPKVCTEALCDSVKCILK